MGRHQKQIPLVGEFSLDPPFRIDTAQCLLLTARFGTEKWPFSVLELHLDAEVFNLFRVEELTERDEASKVDEQDAESARFDRAQKLNAPLQAGCNRPLPFLQCIEIDTEYRYELCRLQCTPGSL